MGMPLLKLQSITWKDQKKWGGPIFHQLTKRAIYKTIEIKTLPKHYKVQTMNATPQTMKLSKR
jgi:hypothetical protein